MTRTEKEKAIRKCFANQPSGGWNGEDIKYYLGTLKIKPQPSSKMTDEEINTIYEDLEKASML